MGYLRLLGLLVVVSFTSNLLTGCSSDSGGVAPASYSGITTQASVTSENSEALAEAALDGAAPGDSGLANAAPSGQTEDKEQLMGVSRSLRSAFNNVDMSQGSSSQAGIATVTSNSDTDTSPCGGTLAYSFSFDDVTGEYSGTFTFTNYVDCDDKSKINGSLTASGVLNLSTYVLTSMNMTFTALTYEEDSESITLSGTMDMASVSTLNYTMTMNLDFRDNVKNETYRLENYIVDITEDFAGFYIDIDVSGKVYHPSYGYVTVTTTMLIRIYNADENPTSGVVELAGAGGSKVVVTFTTNDTYTMDIDSDGDTTFETSKNCTWSTDTCI